MKLPTTSRATTTTTTFPQCLEIQPSVVARYVIVEVHPGTAVAIPVQPCDLVLLRSATEVRRDVLDVRDEHASLPIGNPDAALIQTGAHVRDEIDSARVIDVRSPSADGDVDEAIRFGGCCCKLDGAEIGERRADLKEYAIELY